MNYRHFVAAKGGDWKRGQKANLQKGDFFRHPKNPTAFSVTPTPNISGCRPKQISAPSGKGPLLWSIGGLLHNLYDSWLWTHLGPYHLCIKTLTLAFELSLPLFLAEKKVGRWLACGSRALGQHSIYSKQTDWVSYPFGSFNSIKTY